MGQVLLNDLRFFRSFPRSSRVSFGISQTITELNKLHADVSMRLPSLILYHIDACGVADPSLPNSLPADSASTLELPDLNFNYIFDLNKKNQKLVSASYFYQAQQVIFQNFKAINIALDDSKDTLQYIDAPIISEFMQTVIKFNDIRRFSSHAGNSAMNSRSVLEWAKFLQAGLLEQRPFTNL